MVRIQDVLIFALSVSAVSIPWELKNALTSNPLSKAQSKDNKIHYATNKRLYWKILEQEVKEAQAQHQTLLIQADGKERAPGSAITLDEIFANAEKKAAQSVATTSFTSAEEREHVSDGYVVKKSMERIGNDLRKLGSLIDYGFYAFSMVRASWRAVQIDFKIAQSQLESSSCLDTNRTQTILDYAVDDLEPRFQDTYLKILARKDNYQASGDDVEIRTILSDDKLLVKSFGKALVAKVSRDQIDVAKYVANRLSTTVEIVLKEFTPDE